LVAVAQRGQFTPAGVVEIADRQAQARPGEQPRLGLRVVRHAAVVIEMIARQIGEHRDVNPAPSRRPSAMPIELASSAQACASGIGKIGQTAHQGRRLGRRETGVDQLTRQTGTQRADDRARRGWWRRSTA
jgi:hypothetical protein